MHQLELGAEVFAQQRLTGRLVMVCGSFRFCWTGFIVLHHIQHVSVCFVCTTILIFNTAKLDQSKRVQTTSESQRRRHVYCSGAHWLLLHNTKLAKKDETCCSKFVTLFWNFESAVPRSTPCNLSRGRERSWWTVWIRVAVGTAELATQLSGGEPRNLQTYELRR